MRNPGLTSLRDSLKSQKPSGVTDAQIDTNLQLFLITFNIDKHV